MSNDAFSFLGQHVAEIDQVSVTASLEPRVNYTACLFKLQNVGQQKERNSQYMHVPHASHIQLRIVQNSDENINEYSMPTCENCALRLRAFRTVGQLTIHNN